MVNEKENTLIQRLNSKIAAVEANTTYFLRDYRDINVEYKNASTITLKAGLICKDTTNKKEMYSATNIDVNLEVSGAGGLDTGSEAIGWYYPYIIATEGGTVSGLMSTVDESTTGTITLPTDYVYKRQVPIAICNSLSGATTAGGSGIYYLDNYAPLYSPTIVPFTYNNKSNKVTYLGTGVNKGDLTTNTYWTDTFIGVAKQDNISSGISRLSISNFVPPFANLFSCSINKYAANLCDDVVIYSGNNGTGTVVTRRNSPSIVASYTDIYVGDAKQWTHFRNTGGNSHFWGDILDYTITKRIP